MPVVTFMPSGQSVEVSSGTEIAQAALKAGIMINTPCGGRGTCGKCLVAVVSGDCRVKSHGILLPEHPEHKYVPACCSSVRDSDLTVLVPAESLIKDEEDSRDTEPEFAEHINTGEKTNPRSRVILIRQQDLTPNNERPFDEQIAACLADKHYLKDISFDPFVLTEFSPGSLTDDDTFSLVTADSEVIRISKDDLSFSHCGIAVDIGTTTVSLVLTDLNSGKMLARASQYNKQIKCGLDIISRINYARKPERRTELQELILETIDDLLTRCAKQAGVKKIDIHEAVISANTTMVHLLLGLDPDHIRLEPYRPTVLELPALKASDVGIDIHPRAIVQISPGAGSYVGGDISAGLLTTDIGKVSGEISLLLDIGTNGEIVIGNDEFLVGCACSAGPAFEGGGLKYGLRAQTGAIEKVEIDEATGKAECGVIGSGSPSGICGSGIISLLSELFLKGFLDKSGKLSDKECEFIRTEGRRKMFVIVPGKESESGEDITINETEIENILRTKAAIFAAVTLLLKQLELSLKDISRFYIAGGFGRYLNLDESRAIGLLPDLPDDRFHFMGNTSLQGSVDLLKDRSLLETQREMVSRITYLDLGTDPSYMDHYTGALFLPHTDMKLFPSVEKRLKEV